MDQRIKYALQTFRNLYRVPGEVSIFYGDQIPTNRTGILVQNHAQDFFENKNTVDAKELVFKTWEGTRLPFFFEDSSGHELIKPAQNGVIIPYDLLASAFYFLSGWQEYTSHKRDNHGRFPYRQSLQYKLDSPHVPFVNYYFDILKTAVEQVYDIPLSPQNVGEHPYTLVLTHDIDNIYSGWLQDGYHALKRGEIGVATNILLQKLSGNDPWFNFEEIIHFEKQHEVTSTFFFLASRGNMNDIPHADYSLEDRAVQQAQAAIRDAGSEIELHGDFEAHKSEEALGKNLQAFGNAGQIKGNRFHYLMYDVYQTPGTLSGSGLTYDSTLGFAEHTGFRNGICHPFYLYDLERNRPTEVLEIPLAIMDTTLNNEEYMRLTPDQVLKTIEPLMDELKKFRGTASILWHNSYFSDHKYRGWKSVLSQLIRNAKADGALVTKAATILDAYTDRQQ